MEATLSSKNQVTIPKQVRQWLNLEAGDRLKFFFQSDGAVVILPKTKLSKLTGSPKLDRPITLEEMKPAVAAARSRVIAVDDRS